MKLPFKRSKPKKAQAADVLASAAKLWSDLQLSKRAGKSVKKGTKKASSATSAVGSRARTTPAKAAAGLALLGAAAALVARKLKRGGPEPLPYVPPAAPTPAAAAPGDPADASPVAAVVADPAPEPPAIVLEEVPIALEDLAGKDSDSDEPAGDEPASEGPGADAVEEPPSEQTAPETAAGDDAESDGKS